MLDTLILSRVQFALNISFHILFPTISIALCWFVLFFKIRFDQTQNPVWMRAYRFWVKILALTFALGIVSGVTMSFQFGSNWPGFMEKVGNIAGPLLGYEVLTAFFLEATFLGIMLFGIHRVPSKMHTFSAFMVAVGTTLSAFWILALDSWMQTPSGFEIQNGVVHASNWWAIIFNPSFPYRMTHMLIASGLTTAFLIAGISAYRIQQGDAKHAPQLALKTGLIVAALLAPVQVFIGDLHGLNTFEHQPQKVAAMEGVWHTESGAPLLLFAVPDESQKTNHLEVGIPNLASLILTHHLNGEIKGLSEFDSEPPPVAPIFYAFRLMIAIGVLMWASAWLACYQLYRHKTLPKRTVKWLNWMTFSGWFATLAGWYVTEMGRQPWLVNGLLSTQEAVTTVPPSHVGLSLLMYGLVYAILLVAYIHTLRLMARRSTQIEEYETPNTPSSSDPVFSTAPGASV
ncbi:MAG: cytochrome ubiquinol oxidase subunit I [Gammaproteobacteria bacterium]